MIFLRSGKTGSGKTFDAVNLTYKFWHEGMDIWSNTPLFFTKFNDGAGGENILTCKEYFTFWEKLGLIIGRIFVFLRLKKNLWVKSRGRINYFDTIDEVFHIKEAVILFDEGQTLFRNYDWESIPRLFLYKLEQNRKHGLHLITTVQRPKAININYRELVQDWKHFETIFDLLGFHFYRKKTKDIDYITEDLQESDVPTLKTAGLLNFKTIKPWTKAIYDTFYDIGFEPLQHYRIKLGSEEMKFHLESGMKVKQAIQLIKMYVQIF